MQKEPCEKGRKKRDERERERKKEREEKKAGGKQKRWEI